MASLVEGSVRIEKIKLQDGIERNQTTAVKLRHRFFKGDMWENISDVNRVAPIIHARKRTSLSESVFPDISLNILTIITFWKRYDSIL